MRRTAKFLFVLSIVLPVTTFATFYPYTVQDHVIVRQIFRHIETEDWMSCLQECYMNVDCSSYNFNYKSPRRPGAGYSCELSKCTAFCEGNVDSNSLIVKQGFLFQQLKPSKINKSLCSNIVDEKLPNKNHVGLEASTILNEYGNLSYIEDLTRYLDGGLVHREWQRCYHAGGEDFNATAFHVRCDLKGPTVTIVRVDNYIFGGYIDKSWKSEAGGACKALQSKTAFLFSLYNIAGYSPLKLTVKQEQQTVAVYSCPERGPGFGQGYDLLVDGGNSHTRCQSYEKPSSCSYNLSDTCSFFAGIGQFTTSDVEVFYER